MTKRSFVATLPLLGSLNVLAAQDTQLALADHPYLSPENCSQSDPNSRWEERDEDFKRAYGSSEQAQTRFFEIYAHHLRKWTEEKRPESKASRPHLEEAFDEAMRFINFDVWGGRGHAMPRFSARLEWILWHGWNGHKNPFDTAEAEARYEIEDIRALFVILFKANAEQWKKLDDSRPRIDKSLAALQKAEGHLSLAGQKYFRTQLAQLVAMGIQNC
jgi:hypothetical protein